jgi:hypothetical protein
MAGPANSIAEVFHYGKVKQGGPRRLYRWRIKPPGQQRIVDNATSMYVRIKPKASDNDSNVIVIIASLRTPGFCATGLQETDLQD